jgi:hypothetical protein
MLVWRKKEKLNAYGIDKAANKYLKVTCEGNKQTV